MNLLGSKTIETKRLILKAPTMKEQKKLWEILMIPEVNKYYLTINKKYRENLKKWEKQEKIYETSLVMVGDALVHSSLYNDAYENKTYNFKKYLTYIKDYVSNYDLAYYNQETILGGTSIGLSTYPSFNSPQELGDAMIDAGFNLVSLATNHTLDRGQKAIKLSREYWNKQEQVQAVGSYTSKEEKQQIESKILESNGITYAMLNYTYGTNGISVPKGKDYFVNLWDDTYNYEGLVASLAVDENEVSMEGETVTLPAYGIAVIK